MIYKKLGVEHDSIRRIALLCGILLSGGVLFIPRIPLFLILIFVSFIATGYRGIPLFPTQRIWLLLGAVLLTALIRPGPLDLESLIIRYANFFSGVFLLSIYLVAGLKKLSSDLMLMLPWMAIQSIVNFILANVFTSAFKAVFLDDGTIIYTCGYIFNYHLLFDDSSTLIRPNGLFWEPGVYQIYINIYLYLALSPIGSYKHGLLALLGIACIRSTTGVLIASGILLVVLGKNKIFSRHRGSIKTSLLLAISTVAILWLTVFNVGEKIIGEANGSFLIRNYDITAGWKVIANNPLLGIGFEHRRYQELSYNLSGDLLDMSSTLERSTSNGILYLLYSIGLPMGFVLIICMFKQKFFSDKLLFGFILFFSMAGESLIYTPFFIMIIFSGIVVMPNQSVGYLKNRLVGRGL